MMVVDPDDSRVGICGGANCGASANASWTPVNTLDVIGGAVIGNEFDIYRSSAAAGVVNIMDSSATPLQLTKSGVMSMTFVLNGTGVTKRLDVTDKDNSAVVPLSVSMAGTRAVTVGSLVVGTTAGPVIITGTGAPSATQPVGSLFIRTDGASGTHVYVSQGSGSWTAISGV